MKIYYHPKLKSLSRDLRKNSTLSEVLLWNKLKARQVMSYQFMRQKPIGNYIVDFYCGKLGLVVEIDGDTHQDKFQEDKEREQKLKSLGLSVLRFNDLDIKKDIDGVLETIKMWIEGKQPPLSPFTKGD